MRNIHWSVQLAMLLGLAGLFVLRVSAWLGVLMILIGLGVSIVALRQSHRTTPSAPSAPRVTSRTVRTPVAPPAPAHQPVDRQKLGVLRYTLHSANLDSNAPVFETDDHKIVTVRDILAEILDIAEANGISVEELAGDIVAMYPKIFDNASLAIRQYPDEDLAKSYIARKTMTDLQWQLDDPEANPRNRKSR